MIFAAMAQVSSIFAITIPEVAISLGLVKCFFSQSNKYRNKNGSLGILPSYHRAVMSELFWMEANTVIPVAQRGENEGGWWRKSLGYSLISHN